MGEVESLADLARLLRHLRRQQARRRGEPGLTYREIAARTGWAVSTISEYFSGRTLPPTDRFDVLVRLLETPPAELGALATARDRVEERRRRRAVELSPGQRAARPAVRLTGAPTVGRDGELDLLGRAVAEIGQGRGGTVFILGEAGIGKTRLLREAERAAVAAGTVVLRGRANNPSARYWALAEALFSVLRAPGAPEDPELAPYRSALSQLVPEWRMRRLSGADDSLLVLAEGVLRLCGRFGRADGCVVLLDDLHEADEDTLAVVDYLADNVVGEGVLVVGTMRAETGAAVDLARATGRRGNATVLELTGLADEAVRQLAAGCLGVASEAVPQDLLDQLTADAQGNPFYVEELLASAGQVVRSGNGSSATRVPAAVRASVLDRVTRLGPLGLRVLQPAALLGDRFVGPLVDAVAMVGSDNVLAVLRAAVDAQLVVVDDDAGDYAFRHALTAEALRSGLLPEERVLLSVRAAQAIEAAYPELPDPWCVLAGQMWESAGEKTRAATLFGVAGKRATVQGAVHNALTDSGWAVRHYTQANAPDRLHPLILHDAGPGIAVTKDGDVFVTGWTGIPDGTPTDRHAIAMHWNQRTWEVLQPSNPDDTVLYAGYVTSPLGVKPDLRSG